MGVSGNRHASTHNLMGKDNVKPRNVSMRIAGNLFSPYFFLPFLLPYIFCGILSPIYFFDFFLVLCFCLTDALPFNPLKPSGCYMYHLLLHAKTANSAH
jgi:hypothetical protein